MQFLNELYIIESEKAAAKEARHAINTVNALYNEWKKIKRRINAVDITSTTANKLANISPAVVDKVHEATRLKLATLIMRCLDVPPWKPLSERERVYKRLAPLLDQLQNYDVRTGTGGSLREVVMTRLSAAFCYQNPLEDGSVIFVSYEPQVTKRYLNYLFGDKHPVKTYKMSMLNIPADFQSVVNTIRINHEKAVRSYQKETKKQETR